MPHRHLAQGLVSAIFAAALAACTAGADVPPGGQGGGGSGAGTGAGTTNGVGGAGVGGDDSSGVGIFDAGPGATGVGGGPSDCGDAAKYVYLISSDGMLYKFSPPTVSITPVGFVDCPTFATPYSMSVDRSGTAWVVHSDGSLFKVDTVTAACQATTFVPGQNGFITFGMGFSTDTPGGESETLYVSQSSAFGGGGATQLGKIDTTTLALSVIGTYDAIAARAEMTGTGDAKLFGAFEGSPYVVAEIDKSNAHIVSQAPQSAINYPPGSSNFAFAFWGGEFWLFVGPGSHTDVFRYKPVDGSTALVTTLQTVIVGAGVSTCAPTEPPK